MIPFVSSVIGREYYTPYHDVFENLCFVLQPMYQSVANLDRYAFQYKYDGFNRCIWKKLPGTQYMEYVYRITFSQDGKQRAAGKWMFYEYDVLNRLTRQGECTGQNAASSPVVLVQNYYDGYPFLSQTGFNNSNFYGGSATIAKGKLTGSIVSVPGSSEKLYMAYYYDIQGHLTKSVRSNLLGGYETTSTVYSFSGQPSTVSHVHTASGKTTRTEVYTYTYDHADRVSKVEHTLNGTKVTLADNTYDNLGRLSGKSLHGSATNKLAYTYNIRSWLIGITGAKFTQNLYYADGNNATKCYNGNISSMTWKAGDEATVRGYKLTYDGLSRLAAASYGETAAISTNLDRFTEKVSGYDKNGNITALQRYGQTSASAYGLIDNLSYTLSGNQLNRVDDAVTASAYNGGFEFKDAVKQAGEYTYDANGNLTKDLNKGITGIQYNVLNLPSSITFSDGSNITYLYSADGTKLRTTHKIGTATTTTDYCGNVIYENGIAKQLLTEEGYVSLSDNKYHYYLKDHQGNNRVVINQTGAVEETSHYYPFGGVYAGTGNVQPFKYNGKEYDAKKGLNWYDYGARHYNAVLGRFTTVDPLAEKIFSWSPYTYCYDNPVLHIDPTGKIGETPWDIFNVLLGIKSLNDNIRAGNVGEAIVDGVGVILDAGAAIVPFVPGGVGTSIKAVRTADKVVDAVSAIGKSDKVTDIVNVTKSTEKVKGGLKIEISPENKIDRNLLDPPSKPGNAPISKIDKKPIEIHHVGQNPNGPFKEMNRQDHRGKGNYKKNHPNAGQASKIDRKVFNKAKEEYWKKEYGQ